MSKEQRTEEQHRWQMIASVTEGVSSFISERPQGWKLVQKCLPKIIEYGRNEGILQIRDNVSFFLKVELC